MAPFVAATPPLSSAMNSSVSQFFELLEKSRLLDPGRLAQLVGEFPNARDWTANPPSSQSVADWLVARKEISVYQSKILLAGRSGPFLYDNYKVGDRIQGGRFDGMFRAVHNSTGHPVLLQFATGFTPGSDKWSALVRRVEQLQRLIHKNILQLFEIVASGDFQFMVWEDADGLAPWAASGHALANTASALKRSNWRESCRVICAAGLGLAEFHSQGLVHGDVCPYNLLCGAGGDVRWYCDPTEVPTTGSAILASKAELAKDGIAAKADYLAPELRRDGQPCTSLSDIYGLGCLAYFALSGRPPFDGKTAQEKMEQHANQRIEGLAHLGVPPAVEQVVSYLMAKNSRYRYQDAKTAAQQLVQFASEQTNGAARTHLPSLVEYQRWLSRRSPPEENRTSSPLRKIVEPASAESPQPPVTITSNLESPESGGAPQVVTPSDLSVRRSQRRRTKIISGLIWGAGVFAAIIVAAIVVVKLPMNSDSAAPNTADTTKENAVSKKTTDANDKPTRTAENLSPQAPGGFPVQPDDGRMLWNSPTRGGPIDLRFVPVGAQLFLALRPKSVLENVEGRRCLTALASLIGERRARWEKAAGIRWEEIEQLVISLHGDPGESPRASFVVYAAQPRSAEEWRQGWGEPSAVGQAAAQYYRRGDWAFYLPNQEAHQNTGRLFVMGDQREVKEIAAGNAVVLRREMKSLLAHSDDKRHVTLIFAPNYFFSDGQKLFSGEYSKTLNVLDWMLGDVRLGRHSRHVGAGGLRAGMLSVHVDQDLSYAELRLISESGVDHHTLATRFRDHLAKAPSLVEDYITILDPPPYWKKLSLRFPMMVRFLHRHLRIEAQDRQAVINTVLPGPAAHNLIAATELSLVSAPGAKTAPISSAPAPPQSMKDVLAAKISLEFPQLSLEFSVKEVKDIVDEEFPQLPFDFRVRIIGGDLEKNGITRNQQVRNFSQKDKTVAEVLTAIVMQANPITTVTEPSQSDQKLIWVVASDPDDPMNNPSKKIVLITTRDAAAAKNYTLPSVFRPES